MPFVDPCEECDQCLMGYYENCTDNQHRSSIDHSIGYQCIVCWTEITRRPPLTRENGDAIHERCKD